MRYVLKTLGNVCIEKLGLDVIKSLARALRWEDAGRVTILLHQMN